MSTARFIYSVIMKSFCGSFTYSEIQNHLLTNRKKLFPPPSCKSDIFISCNMKEINKRMSLQHQGNREYADCHYRTLSTVKHMGTEWAKVQCNTPHPCRSSTSHAANSTAPSGYGKSFGGHPSYSQNPPSTLNSSPGITKVSFFPPVTLLYSTSPGGIADTILRV